MQANTLTKGLLNHSDSLGFELLQNLLEASSSKIWLLKITNLLKQYLNAKHVILETYADNLHACSPQDQSFLKEKTLSTIEIYEKISLQNGNRPHPFWIEKSLIVPFQHEGYLEIIWDKKPADTELKRYNSIFLFLESSLKHRTNLIYNHRDKNRIRIFSRLGEILNNHNSLSEQINEITQELVAFTNFSRCQIKIFSKLPDFDNNLSKEYVQSGFMQSIAVIPACENEWLKELQQEKYNILSKRMNPLLKKSLDDVDILLSIRSIIGIPILYKEEPIGVMVFHQCNYERICEEDEINLFKEIALFLSVTLGMKLDLDSIQEKNKYFIQEIELIHSDTLLKVLNELQTQSQLTSSLFSLIMVDIEHLKDINESKGFAAGNLTLNQTTRYIKRLFGNKYQYSRYNNDEIIVIMKDTDEKTAEKETQHLKEHLSNISVLGIGKINYNFSFATYPTHSDSIPALLSVLEEALAHSKSCGKQQISSLNNLKEKNKGKWERSIVKTIPEILVKKSSLKTGPEIMETIQKQVNENKGENTYSADLLDSVQSLAIALDAKDSYTEGHGKNVGEYAYLLAKYCKLDLQEMEWVRLAGVLHDIGKIGIPESILCKPAKLTKEEYEIMKKHPEIGSRILKPIKPLEKVAHIVFHHHEHWDGSGYPHGLSKTDIPIGSRIVCIVDAFHAMTSNRPYRAALPLEEAIKRLQEGKEKQWDPELIDQFIKIVSK